MNARRVLDAAKIKLNIATDKELASAMGVQYGALTSALSRGSIQFEPLINLLLENHININDIFGEGAFNQNNFSSSGISMFGNVDIEKIKDKEIEQVSEVFEKFKEKYNYYMKNGGNLITDKFDADLDVLFEKHDKNVQILRDAQLL